MKLNKALYICLPLMGAVMAGCESDVKMDVTPKKGTLLKITAPSLMSEVSGESELPSVVDVYEFADGLYLRTKTINPAEDSVSVTTASSARIFCVSGAQVGNLTTSSTVEEFLSAKISSPKGAQSAPIFYSGASEINVDDTELTLEMRRGVARIDLACADPRIVIKEVIVDNAPAESLIIESETMLEETETVTYSCKIGEDFDGFLEQVFTIFESSQPVTVRVKGTFDGDLMNFATTIPVIKRNKVYTLGVSGGSDMESTVGISDWQPGENGEGLLALGEMAISKEHSIIPEGVEINPANNDIKFPSSGVKGMKLAFLTKEPLKLGTVLGELKGISITPVDAVATENGYISAFTINVEAQPKCADGYDATVFFNGSSTFYLSMDVEASPYQIPTVRIGGRDWMCFNAVSDNVDDQIYISDPAEIEKMYTENFVDCVSKYFQYGKPNAFSPWVSNNPNEFAEQVRDMPWRTVGMMPVPKGFHVATTGDWQSLIPDNTTIPASYRTASGDSIKATLVTLPGTLDDSPSATTNAQNYLKRYVLFESITTGAKLYLPYAGIKANTTVEIPTQPGFRFDTRTAYWMSEERYIMLIDYRALEGGVDGALMVRNRWNADGFMMVRGVKD